MAATPLTKLPNTLKAAACAVLGGVMFGSEIGYWGQTNAMSSFNRAVTGNADIVVSSRQLTIISCSLYAVSAIFALPPITRMFADGIGRRKTIILAGLLFALAMTIQAASANIARGFAP